MRDKEKDKLLKQIIKASNNFCIDGSNIKASYVNPDSDPDDFDIRIVFSNGEVYDIKVTRVDGDTDNETV